MTENCAFECKNSSEKGLKIHRTLHSCIERTYEKDLHRNENTSKVKSLFIPTLQVNKYWLFGNFKNNLLFNNIILMHKKCVILFRVMRYK